ncbi:MAG: hypothetical protein R3D34_05810 [Nitratireductor sp.]
MIESGKIGLWPNSPLLERDNGHKRGPCYPLFPSARQALSHAIQILGLGRANRVGVPEWSSHCVVSAVARIATPIAIGDALKGEIKLDAIVAYDQWGWSQPGNEIQRLSGLPGSPAIILDKVDSPGPANDSRVSVSTCEIWSFSKVLGFGGGGLLRYNGEFVPSQLESGDFDRMFAGTVYAGDWADIAKTYGKTIPGELELINADGELDALVAKQNEKRMINLSILTGLGIVEMRDWMQSSLNQGSFPGIAPLLFGEDVRLLSKISFELMSNFGVETTQYNFNINGSLIDADYQKCLAFPLHGGLEPDLVESCAKMIQSMV